MQLKSMTMHVLMCIFLWAAGDSGANDASSTEIVWSGKTYPDITLALEGYNEEREPRNLPAIRAAIVELKARIDNDQDAPHAVELLVQFLKAEAVAKFIEQRRSGAIAADAIELQYVAHDSASAEARAILRDALVRYPRSLPVLNAALRSDLLPMDNAKRIEVLQTIVDIAPDAFLHRWELARMLIFSDRMPQARRQLVWLLESPAVDPETTGLMLDGIADLLQERDDECRALASELRPLLSAIPAELPTSHRLGSFAFLKEDIAEGSDRNARIQTLQRLRAQVAAAVSVSACGAED
jgi:hypothetical protein